LRETASYEPPCIKIGSVVFALEQCFSTFLLQRNPTITYGTPCNNKRVQRCRQSKIF